jgi:hypothetical protein
MLSALKRKLESVSKNSFAIHENAPKVAYQPATVCLGAMLGENLSITLHQPVEKCRWVISLENSHFVIGSFRTQSTGYQRFIDDFSPKPIETDLYWPLNVPAKQLAAAPENTLTLLLLLKINKSLFCSYQRTAPGSPPRRTTA